MKGSSLRGLFLVALSGLFTVSALAQDPALTAPTDVKEVGTPDAEITRLNTRIVKFKWNRGGLNNDNQVNFRVFVGSLQGFGEIADSGFIPAVKDKGSYEADLEIPTDGRKVFVRLHWTVKESGIEVLKWRDYVYFAANQHYIYSPVPGTGLALQDVDGCKAPPMVTFDWEVVQVLGEPVRWWFYLGTLADTDRYYNSGQLTRDQRSVTITNIPTAGDPVIATLWWDPGDSDGNPTNNWQSNIFQYGTPTLPAITSPAPGGSLPGTTGNLVLDPNGLPVQYWWVYAGPARQTFDYHSNGQQVPADDRGTVATLEPFQNFPDDGSNVFVTLFWRLTGEGPDKWKCREFTFKASSGPVIVAPIKGGDNPDKLPTDLTNPTNTQTVTWDDKGTQAQQWQVVVNETGDASDNGVWKSGLLGADVRSVSVPNSKFTTDGRTVYIILRYWVGGGLAENLFTDAVICPFETQKVPYLTAPGSIVKCHSSFLGNEATFEWTDGNYPNVLGYWLYVGSEQGGRQYHNSGALSATTMMRTLTNLPTDGNPLWVRLWWLVEIKTTGSNPDPSQNSETIETTTRKWLPRDFLFTNPQCPEITSPGIGATIVGTQRDITIDKRGVNVDGLWVTVSSAAPTGGDAKNPNPGTADIDNSNLLAADTDTFRIRNLPIDGSKVYVTLWWLVTRNQVSAWEYRTWAYTSSETVPVPRLRAPNADNGDARYFAPLDATNDGLKLGSTTYNFVWERNNTVVFGWWLYVADNQAADKGGQVGGTNIYNSGFLQPGVLSAEVSGLKAGTNYVRLWYLDEFTQWKFLDFAITVDLGGGGGGGGVTGPENETDGNGDNNGLG